MDADAKSQGIYTRFSADPALPVNRDNACLLIYNAMQSWAIDGYSEDGTVVYVMDALRNPVSFLEARFDVVRYTGVVTGNECADLLTGGVLESGVTKLQGHTAFQVSSDLSLVGQCVDIYVRNNQVVGTPLRLHFRRELHVPEPQGAEDLCQLTDYQVSADAAVYYNYTAAEAAVLDTLRRTPPSPCWTRMATISLKRFWPLPMSACGGCRGASDHPPLRLCRGSSARPQR